MEKQVTYTKAKDYRKGVRIWIEGQKLTACGFEPGARYNITLKQDARTIILDLDEQGTRGVTVSRRNGKERPIIDLTGEKIASVFNADMKIRVLFQQGQIVITQHHEGQLQDEREETLKAHLEAGTIQKASMFTGGGISTEAIHHALQADGIQAETAWIAESETKYIESAGERCLSITDDTVFLSGKVEEIEDYFYSKVDLLSFSLPCAGFGKAGKAKHKLTEEDHSGTALFGVVSAIKASNPAVCVSENVVEAQDSAIYRLLKCELIRLGYTIFEQVLDQSHTDSIEQRKRYWLVAISSGIAPASLELAPIARSGRTIESILEPVPESAWSDNQYLKDKAARDAAAGKGFKRQLLTGIETACGTIGRFYQKRRSTEPFIVRDDGKERLFTPREHAAVKSIPAYLVEGLLPGTAHEILGQSVDYLQPFNLMRSMRLVSLV